MAAAPDMAIAELLGLRVEPILAMAGAPELELNPDELQAKAAADELERRQYVQQRCRERRAQARAEARFMMKLAGKRGETVQSLRESIEIAPCLEDALRCFTRVYPSDRAWVDDAIEFRREVLEEFEKLAAETRPDGDGELPPERSIPAHEMAVAAQ